MAKASSQGAVNLIVFSREVETIKFGVLNFPVSREIYVGMPENCLCNSKDFRDIDIYHSDTKNALEQILNFFYFLKVIFQNSQNLLRRNAYEIKNFSSICRKN